MSVLVIIKKTTGWSFIIGLGSLLIHSIFFPPSWDFDCELCNHLKTYLKPPSHNGSLFICISLLWNVGKGIDAGSWNEGTLKKIAENIFFTLDGKSSLQFLKWYILLIIIVMIFFSFLLIFRDIHVPDVYLVLNYINLDFHFMIDPIQYTCIYFLLYAKSYKEEKKKSCCQNFSVVYHWFFCSIQPIEFHMSKD